jgi:hypothetical protein
MTVRELMEKLIRFDYDAEVVMEIAGEQAEIQDVDEETLPEYVTRRVIHDYKESK